jgi:hypothetical protein
MSSAPQKWSQAKWSEEFLCWEGWLSNQEFRQSQRTWLNVDYALPHEKLFEQGESIE